MVYSSPDPIPSLWLTLQPQLASLTAGTGAAKVQVQFEISVSVDLTGRVPRVTRAETPNTLPITGSSYLYDLGGVGTNNLNNIPLFVPTGRA